LTTPTTTGWRIERSTDSAAGLLEPWPPDESRDDVVVRAGRVTGGAALVLGSTQNRTVVDEERAAAAGVDVLRRPTGGGAVMVDRDAQVWLDFWVPRAHHLWDEDIIGAALWLGHAWAEALGGLGAGPLRVHRGPATRGVWSERVCFAGLGPGEVFVVSAEGTRRKVTGLAQRRTRAGARFHTTAPLIWDPAPLLSLLVAGEGEEAGRRGEHSGGERGHDDAPAPLTREAVGLRSLLRTDNGDGADADVLTTVEDAVITALP
jgi:hypothetical protein